MIRHSFEETGLTLIELMMAMAVAGIFLSAMVLSFGKLMQGTTITRQRTVASNLAQERLEELKDYAYHRLVPTTAAALINPNDATNPFPVESIPVQGVTFTRYTVVEKATTVGSSLTMLGSNANDAGLKFIQVAVTWVESTSTKSVTLSSLLEDPNRSPLDSMIYGMVTDPSSVPVPNVNVYVVSNPNWSMVTNAAGQYTLQVANGTYQVSAANDAYVTQTSGNLALTTTTLANNFTNYTLKQTGMVSGYVFVRPYLVISKICTKLSADNDHEFLEVYNPTSVTLTMSASTIKLTEVDGNNNLRQITVTYLTPTVRPYGYYLFANSAQVVVLGVTYAADATWPDSSALHTTKGGVILASGNGQVLDKVAWAPSGQSAPSNGVEGNGFDLSPDPDLTDRCLERRPYPGVSPAGSSAGSAYDSQNNASDFYKHAALVVPYTSATGYTETPTGGTIVPQLGMVFVDDGLSSTVVPSTLGAYEDTNVGAGTWVIAASGGLSITGLTYSISMSNLIITNNARITQDVVLTSGSSYGYVVGKVTTGGTTALTGILVRAGSSQTRSVANGSYYFPLVDGTYSVTANYNYDNTSYSQDIYNTSLTLTAGTVFNDINFDLSGAGGVSGKVTVNGTDPIPNVRVVALDVLNAERGSAVTDSSGNYTISGLPTSGNAYSISPALDPRETSSPTSIGVSVASGSTASGKNFTVTNALVTISGAVKISGAPISTGVIIVATTGTIAGDPPTNNSTLRSGGTVYYCVTSDSEGQYALKVRGAASPGTTYNVYAWYTNTSGTTTKKSTTKTAIAGGAAVTADFTTF